MFLQEKKITFTNKVLNLLAAMGKIVVSEATGNKYISKDNIIFAKIIADQVYLRAPVNYVYVPVDEKTLQNHDLFLKTSYECLLAR